MLASMGYWGTEPWQNDGAMNWFDNFFEQTGLAVELEATLSRSVEENADEIRAAVMVLLALDRVVWAGDIYETLVVLAGQRLAEMLECGVYVNQGITESIEAQLARLSKI